MPIKTPWVVKFQSSQLPPTSSNWCRDVVGVLKAASEERGDSLGTCFSLTHGTAFSLFAAQIFRMLEDEDPSVSVRHPGPVTLGSLKQHAAVNPRCLEIADVEERGTEYKFPGFQGEDAFGVGGERVSRVEGVLV
jgi:hypothetical protein